MVQMIGEPRRPHQRQDQSKTVFYVLSFVEEGNDMEKFGYQIAPGPTKDVVAQMMYGC